MKLLVKEWKEIFWNIENNQKVFFFPENEEEYDDDLEFPEGSDRCEKEAIRLALKYNFVTDVTSMVVEEDDEYITKKNLEEKEVKQKDTTQYSYLSRSSANMPQYNMASNVYKNSYSSSNYGSVSKMASIPMMATTGRPNLAQRYATFENEVKVRSDLLRYFIYKTLNVIGSFDVNKIESQI